MTQTQTQLERADPPQMRIATGTLPPNGDSGERPRRGFGCGCFTLLLLIGLVIGCILWLANKS